MSCQQCNTTFTDAASHVSEVHLILSRFFEEEVRHEHLVRGKVKELSLNIADTVNEHMSFSQQYFRTYNKNMHSSAKQYWEKYGTACPYSFKSVGLKKDGSIEYCEENSTSNSNTVEEIAEEKRSTIGGQPSTHIETATVCTDFSPASIRSGASFTFL